MALVAGCGRNARRPVGLPDEQTAADLKQLKEQLALELAERGIDTEKAAAAAPTGASNAVFDLTAEVIDPDGEGPGLPTGISLSWTERLIGDYDQNSEVNAADITPLVHYWYETPYYDDPASHGGFTRWPAGDPADAGALNWRIARVDGDCNGELNITDITPISQHWKEQLSGYRVMRRAPGEASFSVVEIQGGPAGYTIEHPQPVTDQPVRYAFTDDDASPGGLGDGVYEYYVAAYDAQSGQAGPPSATVYVDLTTGEVNLGPVAALAITPGFGGAPAEITLDASGSYDLDGTIAAYEWDFDADGVVDWLSSEAIPQRSSTGGVVDITPTGTGVVTAGYLIGSAKWFYPRVTVVDDKAQSHFATDRLGISGWETRLLNYSFAQYELLVEPRLAGIDPATGEVTIVGQRQATNYHEKLDPLLADGVYLAWQISEGQWEYEMIDIPAAIDGVAHDPLLRYMFWDEYGQPVVLFLMETSYGSKHRVWSAQRLGPSNWQIEERFYTSAYDHQFQGNSIYAIQSHPGTVACLVNELLSDKPSLSGSGRHYRWYMLRYHYGEWSFEYTGYDSAERWETPRLPVQHPNDDISVVFNTSDAIPGGVWWAHWEDGVGLGEPERADDGSAIVSVINGRPLAATISNSGVLYSVHNANSGGEDQRLTRIEPDGTTNQFPLAKDYAFRLWYIPGMHVLPTGAGFFVTSRLDDPDVSFTAEYHRLENDTLIVERIIPDQLEDTPAYAYFSSAAILAGKPIIAFILQSDPVPQGEPGRGDFSHHYRIAKRVDPRGDW